MSFDLYKKVEDYVTDAYSENGKLSSRGMHLLKTKDWLMEICPEADEAMQIAAVAHDIDCAFIDYKFAGGFKDPEYLSIHQAESAKMMKDFLLKNGADIALANRVVWLIEKHEVGGDDEQNLIKDADSLGFFDRNLPEFIERHKLRGHDKEQLKEKIDWMFTRITTEKAKAFAEPMYREALKILEGK